jgi:hypothetical protein
MKCIVKDCENHKDQGVFVGVLCMPCHTFLTTGEGKYSQLYRNTVAAEREACIKAIKDVDDYQSPAYPECIEAILARGRR